MSKPVFKDAFSFTGRRNRKSFILMSLAQLAGLIVVGTVLIFAVALASTVSALAYVLLAAGLVTFVAIAVSCWAVASQRIRDFGHSGVWVLLSLIPYVGWLVFLAICFVPSSEGENRYGQRCI